jgi:hypothetical protein
LHGGLSIEHDVPAFLRLLGGARDPAHVERLASALDALLARVEKTRRARSTVEADPKLTLAYVSFVVAYGAARLGRSERARALVAQATGALDVRDPVHGFLAAAYAARVAQAVEGLPPEAPLSPEIAARLNALDKLSRYKVDRVRQFSTALEPHERLDPIVAFHRGEPDPRGAEFAALRGTSDVPTIEDALVRILGEARAAAPDERARLYDGAMDFFPTITTGRAQRHLEEVVANVADVAPARRAQLLEEALMLAGHLGDPELGRRIFHELEPLIAGLAVESAAEIAKVTGGMLRTLRRVGLREEAALLLETMQKAAAGAGAPAMIARLHTASALAYLGRVDSAKSVFEETLGALAADVPVPLRLDLTRALARGVVNAPEEYALGVLEQLAAKLQVVTDSFNTNSHLCLSVIAFVEAIVLGYASDDLAMGELGRRWLDDDEYLIRRRIQRDMTETR